MQTNRNGFSELLQRYIDGTCSAEEQQVMDYWYSLLGSEPAGKTNALSDDQQEALLWAKIQRRLRAKMDSTLKPWRKHDGS
ncbi:hypothetical protein ACFQ4C_25430 [Larkinella insperata]|uniref:Uncharacterized protein n=1 Tax=Larkinella insperata TaxID=332158 RepID=A0ABW3QGI3_9BACT|nr:hypothetical protein [Larkinella insperata]